MGQEYESEGIAQDVEDKLDSSTYGLSALRLLLVNLGVEVDAIEAKLDNATYGLNALNTDLDVLLARLTAARAGYLDNINNAELALFERWQRSEQIYFQSGIAQTAAGTTRYVTPTSKNNANTLNAVEFYHTTIWLVSRAGTLRNLVCFIGTAAGGGQSQVFTVRVNGVPTALTVTLAGAGAANQIGNDLVNTVAVVAGDYVTMQIVTSAGAGNAFVAACFDFEG